MPFCHVVPPYLLEALATSGDPELERRARATMAVDAELRAGRVAGGLLAPRSPRAAAPRRPRLKRGTDTGPVRQIHDAGHGIDLPGTKVRGEGDPATSDGTVNEAYDGLGATSALWEQGYGRNSLDGRGLPLLASVHFSRDYDNAFWDGSQMVFGDGDGVIFLPFTRSLDVIAHELAHGVTQYTSGLNYQDQSGALNESISDVFGVLVVQHHLGQAADEATWLIGADLLAPGVRGVALRSMKAPGTAYDDPRLGRDPQPDHFRDYVETDEDNGGVHINSGIPNRAFHLTAMTLGGNAWGDAGQIWVDAITGDIRADCDFATFAELTIAAASARFGAQSPQVRAVSDAWATVGVPYAGDSPPRPPAPSTSTEITVVRTGGVAGLRRESTVTLADLRPADARAWRQLLEDPESGVLENPVSSPERRPDGFSYRVRCASPALDVTIAEGTLTPNVRRLLERTVREP